MASYYNNPISFLIPKSETRTVSSNLRSGSKRSKKKKKEEELREPTIFLHSDTLKHDY